jgi:hypothetical protein
MCARVSTFVIAAQTRVRKECVCMFFFCVPESLHVHVCIGMSMCRGMPFETSVLVCRCRRENNIQYVSEV